MTAARAVFRDDVERQLTELAGPDLTSHWSAEDDVHEALEVALRVQFQVAFERVIADAKAGPLPSWARRTASVSELRDTLAQARLREEAELPRRIERWVSERAAPCDAVLPAEACSGGRVQYGYQSTCEHCRGDKRVRCHGCGGKRKTTCDDCLGKGRRARGAGEAVPCMRCKASGATECSLCHGQGARDCRPCEGSGVRHALGAVECTVTRSFSLSLPRAHMEQHAVLLERATPELLATLAPLERRSATLRDGVLTIEYAGALEATRCDVRVGGQVLATWSYGEQGALRDYTQLVQRVLDAALGELMSADGLSTLPTAEQAKERFAPRLWSAFTQLQQKMRASKAEPAKP